MTDRYCAESIVFRSTNCGRMVVKVTGDVLAVAQSQLSLFKGCHGSIVYLETKVLIPFVNVYFKLIFFAL